MAKLISVIGASGAGKTSLVRALSTHGDFALGLEGHAERPFQALFERDRNHALANQVDFFLFRAEQERLLRADPRPALIDGGLDLDFHGFTRLFHTHGWLTDPEFNLLRRLYEFVRGSNTSGTTARSTRPPSLLPPPDLIVHLAASEEAVRARLENRHRINIASANDASLLAAYLVEWLASIPAEKVLRLDVTQEPPDYSNVIPIILTRIDTSLRSAV